MLHLLLNIKKWEPQKQFVGVFCGGRGRGERCASRYRLSGGLLAIHSTAWLWLHPTAEIMW